MAKFEIFEDRAGEFRFRLVANNGETVASSEGYTQKQGCEHGISVIKEIASEAEVVDLT